MGLLDGHRHRDAQTRDTVHAHLVHQVDGGQGFNAEHTGVGRGRGDGERGIGGNVHGSAELGIARTQVGGVDNRTDRGSTGRERFERVFLAAVFVLDRLVVGADQNRFGMDLCAAADLDVGRACHQVGDRGATAGVQTDGNVQGLGIKVLVAVGEQVQQADQEFRLAAHARNGGAQNLQVGHSARTGDQAAAGGR